MDSSYIPEKDSERMMWLNNFSNRIGQYAATLDLLPADIDSIQNDAAMFAYTLRIQSMAVQYAAALTGLKNQLRNSPRCMPIAAFPETPDAGPVPVLVSSGIFRRIAQYVLRIKRHAAYSPAIGEDLGILPVKRQDAPEEMQPALSVRLESGYPVLKWRKKGTDGIHLYVDRRDGNGFLRMVRTVRTSFTDQFPVSGVASWDYKARYLAGDDEVGQFSPVVSVRVLRE